MLKEFLHVGIAQVKRKVHANTSDTSGDLGKELAKLFHVVEGISGLETTLNNLLDSIFEKIFCENSTLRNPVVEISKRYIELSELGHGLELVQKLVRDVILKILDRLDEWTIPIFHGTLESCDDNSFIHDFELEHVVLTLHLILDGHDHII